jgi:hypothetical protein
MKDYLYLNKSMHISAFKNLGFDLDDEDKKHIKEYFELGVDGSILGVLRSKVSCFFSDPEVKKIRYGLTTKPKTYKVSTEDQLFEMLSHITSLEED